MQTNNTSTMPRLPTTMSGVQLTGHGDVDRLRWSDSIPVPRPARGDVLIRVRAAGVNNTDINLRTAWYSKGDGAARDAAWSGSPVQFPRIQGIDACGHVVAVGAGVSEREAEPRIRTALEGVGLAQFAQAYPRQLSGGMRMRVSIARALVTRPPLLLMDEPFAALDEISRFKLNDDLLALARGLKTTVVFVTHSVFESVYLSSRIAVFSARPGRVVQTIEVDGPAVRDVEFRLSPQFAESCRRASAALDRASGRTAA